MSDAAARPQVSVFDAKDGEGKVVKSVALPAVMTAPIRPDLVRFIHTQVAKNHRQAYSVKDQAGMDTAAESWGTGRAVSRIPRVPGGGTHRAGQGAFGNMCRGGRMFHPTRIWRKWHKKVAVNQKRYAICSALAASAVPALVMARGHRISQVPELPLIVGGDSLDQIKKTKDSVKFLELLGAGEDIKRVKDNVHIRAGKGKMRNRRYVKRRGPLVIHSGSSADLCRSLRNIEGVDVCHVDRLNLLQLAPGGHIGRFCVWTQGAIERLDALYGTQTSKSTEKANYILPRPIASNADISRIISSEEVQKVLRPIKKPTQYFGRKANPLRNSELMAKLNPYAAVAREAALKAEKSDKKVKKAGNTKAARRAFYEKMIAN